MLYVADFCLCSGPSLTPEVIEAYQRAKLKGEQCSNQFKLVTLGAEGAGKSSTISTLFNEKFDPHKKSTIGAAVNTCTVDHHMATGWKKIKDIPALLKKLHRSEIRTEIKNTSLKPTSSNLLPVEQIPQNISEIENTLKDSTCDEGITYNDCI